MSEDQLLQKLICFVRRGWPRESAVPDVLKQYSRIRDELCWEDELVFRSNLLVPPLILRRTLVELAHEGHAGTTAT